MPDPRVLHISTSDLSGGAARAAHRLHRALRERGVASRMLVRSRRSDEPDVAAVGYPKDRGSKLVAAVKDAWSRRELRRYAASRPAGYDPFSDDRCGATAHLLSLIADCDVVHLHWVRGLLDYRQFFAALPSGLPVVWTLHDMHALTGGCHYDHGCGRFMTGCGACPQLGSSDSGDLSARSWRRKQAAFESFDRERLTIVTPSRWLGDVARRSPLLGRFRVEAIPNGIDTEAYAPRDRRAARQALGLPGDAKVLAFVAHGLGGIRKGFDLLREALLQLPNTSSVWLLSAGGAHGIPEVSIPHVCLGPVENDRLLSLVYSAADVFVIPSVQDNLPNTVLESLACGTPVVGFDTGGIPEMVEPGRTGWLAPVSDAAALSRALAEALAADETREAMRQTCREVAVERYDLSMQAEACVRLYRSVVAARPIATAAAASARHSTPAVETA